MKKIPGMAGRVRIGAPDASLTAASGVVAVTELVGRLGVTAALDDAIGEIKQRDRGLSAGEFLVALAQAQMFGARFWTGLDRRRADTAGEALSAVATPASTTAVGLAERFGPARLAGVEEGIGEIMGRVLGGLPATRKQVLRAGGATIDLDGTDVECYGSAKDGIAYNYKGQRAGRPHVATWAEAGMVTAADLLAGDEDPRPGAGSLIERSVATLRTAGVTARPKVRGDVGYFAKNIAWAAVEAGCDFSLGVTRNPAVWRAAAAISEKAWRKAERMKGAQVAVCDYAPAGWPPGTVTVVRRVKVRAADISTDPRARRRRSPKVSSPWRWTGWSSACTRTRSSPPTWTCPPRPRRSRWRPGTARGPTLRIASGMPSTAPRCGTCPPAAGLPTRCGCGARCWRSTCPPGCRSWPASTTVTDAAGPIWAPCATDC